MKRKKERAGRRLLALLLALTTTLTMTDLSVVCAAEVQEDISEAGEFTEEAQISDGAALAEESTSEETVSEETVSEETASGEISSEVAESGAAASEDSQEVEISAATVTSGSAIIPEEEWEVTADSDDYQDYLDEISAPRSALKGVDLQSYSSAYPNTWTNTGNQAIDITRIALTQVGYEETGNNHTKYNYWYYGSDTSAAWCAIFISWCANQAGISTSTIKKNAVASGYKVSTMAKNSFATANAYKFSAVTPKVGDIAYIDTNSDGVTNHVALVAQVSDDYVYTVEGNVSGACRIKAYGRKNGIRTDKSTINILFLARPAYKGSSIVVEGMDCLVHTYDKGTVTRASTCTEKGIKTCTCTVCGYQKTESLALAAHTYERNYCSVCGSLQTLSKPVMSTATNTLSGIQVTWKAVEDALAYRLYRKEEGGKWTAIADTSGTTWLDENTEDGVTYYYTACCMTEDYSSSISSYDTTGLKVLAIEAKAPVTTNCMSGVKVSWTADSQAQTYRVYRRLPGGSWTKLTDITKASTAYYVDTTAVSGETYQYAVRMKKGGYWGYFIPTTQLFLSGITVTLTNKADGIRLTWPAVEGAASYYIYRRSNTTEGWTLVLEAGADIQSYTDTDVTSGKTVYYGVKAVNGSTKGSMSGVQGYFLSALTAQVTAAAAGPKVSWQAVDGASSYRVYRRVSGGSFSRIAEVDSSVTSYTDSGAVGGTLYDYCVRAVNGSWLGTYTAASFYYLAAPTLSYTCQTGGLKLSWTASTGAEGYRVYRKNTSTGVWEVLTEVSASVTSYLDKNAENGKGSYYTVRAIRADLQSACRNKYCLQLLSPTLSTLTNLATRKLKVTWSGNTAATGYQIQYSTSSSFSSAKTVTVTGASSVSKTISSLTKGKTYYVRIRAYKTVNGSNYYSAWSAKKSLKIKK